MVLVDGRPILEHHLRWLRANGITKAILLTGYLHEVVEDYFATPRIDGLTTECVAEVSPLGRGGAFKNGYREAGLTDSHVIATNGDVLTSQSLHALLSTHHSTEALATIMLTPMVSPFGVVDLEGDLVTSFSEKPMLPYWINAGVYVLSAEAIHQFPSVGDHETDVFPALADERRLAAVKSHSYWKSIESPKDLRDAEAYLTGQPST
jgi:NDP-sugar pyrophosphorylase family protein